MTHPVTIVDYGIGNIYSIANALHICGAEPVLCSDPDAITAAEKLVLPGVGAFKEGMNELQKRELAEAVSAFTKTGRPFLGICLGMQMMLQESFEFGQHRGLDLIPGKVDRIPDTGRDGRKHKIPHIGWNRLFSHDRSAWDRGLFDGIPEGCRVYFVHSYVVVLGDPRFCLAETDYNGRILTAALHRDNLYGCQFHPEKSGEVGLQMLKNFIFKL